LFDSREKEAMSSLLLRSASVLVLVIAIACRSPTDAGGVRIVPEHDTFVLGASGSVVVHYSVTNASSSAVMLTNPCGSDLNPYVERASSGNWTEYSGRVCSGFGPRGLSLSRAETRVDSLSFFESGTYRFVIPTDRGEFTSPGFRIE
jgi:hypothetical protein